MRDCIRTRVEFAPFGKAVPVCDRRRSGHEGLFASCRGTCTRTKIGGIDTLEDSED